MFQVVPTDSSGTVTLHPSSTSTLVAALAKASPLPPARRLLRRASSLGHALENHPALPKRRRITVKSGPRIEFVVPVLKHTSAIQCIATGTPSSTSSHGTASSLPLGDPKVILPELDVDDNETQALYAGYSTYFLKTSYIDRQKIKIWCRSGVMKFHREEVSALISVKRKIPVDVRKKTLGRQLQWACQQYITEMVLSKQKQLILKIHADFKGDKHADDRAMLACWLYRKDYHQILNNGDGTRWINARCVLLTWQGNFGLIDPSPYKAYLDDAEALTLALTGNDIVVALQSNLEKFSLKAREEYHLQSVSWSTELCVETLAKSRTIRVHCHCFLEAKAKKKIACHNPESLRFEGALPQKRTEEVSSAIGVGSGAQPACGHYYLRMPKIGLIFSGGTQEPFLGYRINAEWIIAYVQNQKLTASSARKEILKTFKNTKTHIDNLNYTEALLHDEEVDVREKKIVADFMKSLPKLRSFTAVTEWLKHMSEPAMRHKPLVLDGPSQTFKTTAAKTFALNQANYIEINCASLVHEPNLRVVKAGCEVINFDELKAKTFVEQKKLFQGGIGPTSLGENTPGGAQAYTRRLNGIKMVICSNHFKRDVEKLDDDDQDYIWKNIYYVGLGPGETMFEAKAPLPSTSSSFDHDILDGICFW